MKKQCTCRLNKPIFIVGNAKGGSTALAALVNFHSEVGPKPVLFATHNKINELLDAIAEHRSVHSSYAEATEQKDVWFDYFPGRQVFTHMGRELIVEHSTLSSDERSELTRRLTHGLVERRYLSKAPTNTFRVKAIKELYPDAKIVAIVRDGVEVVGSYMGWHYRERYRKMGYLRGTLKLARKWNETISYISATHRDLGYYVITYDDLVRFPQNTLLGLFDYLELPIEEYIYDVRMNCDQKKWKIHTPLQFQLLGKLYMMKNQRLVNAFKKYGVSSNCN